MIWRCGERAFQYISFALCVVAFDTFRHFSMDLSTMREGHIPLDEKIRPYTLLRSEKEAVGDVILICSELDHLISVALFKTAEIHGDIGFSLLGRSTIGARLKHLRSILKASDTATNNAFATYTAELDRFLAVRNAFAHGQFMGVLNDNLCFLVTADPSSDEDDVIFKLKQIGRDELRHLVSFGRFILDEIKRIFNVSALHTEIPYTLARQKSRGKL